MKNAALTLPYWSGNERNRPSKMSAYQIKNRSLTRAISPCEDCQPVVEVKFHKVNLSPRSNF